MEEEFQQKYGEGSLERLLRRKLGKGSTASRMTATELLTEGGEVTATTNRLIKGGNASVSTERLMGTGDTSFKVATIIPSTEEGNTAHYAGETSVAGEKSNKGVNIDEAQVTTVVMNQDYPEKKSTWSDIIGKKVAGREELSYIPPAMENGKQVIHVKSAQFAEFNKKFENLIVGSFVGKRLNYNYVKDIVSRTWGIRKFTMKPY